MSKRGKWKRPQMTLERLLGFAIPEPNSGCWLWMGMVNQYGYGRANLDGVRTVAHRASYLLAGGVIPDGHELDHLCRVRCCINPQHLEPVTREINVRRGMAPTINAMLQRQKKTCPYGHPYSGENLFLRPGTGYRECRECMRNRLQQQRAMRRA